MARSFAGRPKRCRDHVLCCGWVSSHSRPRPTRLEGGVFLTVGHSARPASCRNFKPYLHFISTVYGRKDVVAFRTHSPCCRNLPEHMPEYSHDVPAAAFYVTRLPCLCLCGPACASPHSARDCIRCQCLCLCLCHHAPFAAAAVDVHCPSLMLYGVVAVMLSE